MKLPQLNELENRLLNEKEELVRLAIATIARNAGEPRVYRGMPARY
jgi:hypothetical protein